MAIPHTRADLEDLVAISFEKLTMELDRSGPSIAELPCVGHWNVKDLLAVRAWWTERVAKWVDAGLRGEPCPALPADGYTWNETPRLNDDIVWATRDESYQSVRSRLHRGVARVLDLIDALEDHELLEAGAFAWAGRWPVSRWIALNTARQYTTARTFIRRALRNKASAARPSQARSGGVEERVFGRH